MVWLPVAFVCLFGGDCVFHSGDLSVSVEQCTDQNYQVRHKFATNPRISKFQITCIEIQSRELLNDISFITAKPGQP